MSNDNQNRVPASSVKSRLSDVPLNQGSNNYPLYRAVTQISELPERGKVVSKSNILTFSLVNFGDKSLRIATVALQAIKYGISQGVLPKDVASILESGLVDRTQKMTVSAGAMAEENG